MRVRAPSVTPNQLLKIQCRSNDLFELSVISLCCGIQCVGTHTHSFVYLVAIYTGASGYQVITIAPADQIPVKSGYYIGWWVYIVTVYYF